MLRNRIHALLDRQRELELPQCSDLFGVRGLDTFAFINEHLRMQPQTFERGLRAFSQRVPFQPFAVELVSGALVTVDHPEALVFRGGLAAYIAPDGTPSLFDHEGVSQLSGAHGSQSKQVS